MQYLDKLINYIKDEKKVLLMFDYDGTLTPIVKTPDLAILNDHSKTLIEQTANKNNIELAIITGRRIEDLQKLSKLQSPNIHLHGFHGGEFLLENKIHTTVLPSKKKAIKELKQEITELHNLKGILMEDKDFSISIHYRLASKDIAKQAIDLFVNKIKAKSLLNDFKLQKGKSMIEILPRECSKSNAVKYLQAKYNNHLPVFFGDDITDISAFEETKKHCGLTFLVESNINYSATESITINQLINFFNKINP